MSIWATVAIVCTMSACNDHHIDTAESLRDGETNTNTHIVEYQRVWEDETGLTSWLDKHQIGETVFEIVSIDIETHEIAEELTP